MILHLSLIRARPALEKYCSNLLSMMSILVLEHLLLSLWWQGMRHHLHSQSGRHPGWDQFLHAMVFRNIWLIYRSNSSWFPAWFCIKLHIKLKLEWWSIISIPPSSFEFASLLFDLSCIHPAHNSATSLCWEIYISKRKIHLTLFSLHDLWVEFASPNTFEVRNLACRVHG